ncbi:MAG: IPT/TIG domain-containing protein [Calditrichaeota bacterium]|nr:IPT/TIG domain-containing protein [Calditrichota bacterium]HQU71089.1 IPT/TIG domain-containing protein [Calditrichia bacterium]
MLFKPVKTFVLAGLCAGMLISSCEKTYDDTVYGPGNPDPNPTGSNPASVSGISPSEGFLKEVLTISGSGFDSNPDNNLVQFGNRVGEVVSASPTQIEVIAPNLQDDTVGVRVAVKGAELWSNPVSFYFLPTLNSIDTETVNPKGVAVDDSGNVYFGGADAGEIYKVTPDGDRSFFAAYPINGAMEFGPGGWLWVCDQGNNEIARISPDGSTIETVVQDTTMAPVDFDWHASGDLYIVGNGQGVFRYDGSTVTQLAFLENAKSLRIFEDKLYVTDIWANRIMDYDISGGTLINENVFLEYDPPPVGIEVDEEGTVYFSPAWSTSLVAIYSDGSEEILYEDQLLTPMRYLTFYDKTMYIVYPGFGDIGEVMSAYIGVRQAPNHGRQ